MMLRKCYTTVSDLAICQRCPALLGYKIHMHESDAWLQGIKGKGSYYGSMFHENIARVFFEAASDAAHPLHASLGLAISEGLGGLEDFVRENIFMPFVRKFSRRISSGQIMAAAEGVTVWMRAMNEFFSEIPSLKRNPAGNMSTVFLAPEQQLQAGYDFPNNCGRLIVTGRYDALMFNPDKTEARLFEFKGHSKTDAVVPLTQSVVYAWLIEKFSGIVPSVEIIYLDEEDRKPDIFSSEVVKDMIYSELPGLFYAAFNTITLRRLPDIMKDKDFCGECRFRKDCAYDWAMKFRKRKGASMVNVIVFMAASVMIIAHVFFFSTMSAETKAIQVKAMQNRFRFDRALDEVINDLEKKSVITVYDDRSAAAFANYDKVKEKIDEAAFEANIIVDYSDIAAPEEITLSEDVSGDQTITPLPNSYVYENYQGFHESDPKNDYKVKINDTETSQPTVTRKRYEFADNIYAFVYDLNYAYINNRSEQINHPNTLPGKYWDIAERHERIFPPMHKDGDTRYFLIRIYRLPPDTAQKKHMYQVLVKREISSAHGKYYDVKPLSFQEVWY